MPRNITTEPRINDGENGDASVRQQNRNKQLHSLIDNYSKMIITAFAGAFANAVIL